MILEDRYYVQRLTEQVFLIRERSSTSLAPGPDDRIVRTFDMRHDAYMFTDSLNEKQKKLDESSGHWVEKAIEAGERQREPWR